MSGPLRRRSAGPGKSVCARALLNRLEAALLAKAFCGKIGPQDLANEPASVLLGRIRA